MAPSGTAPKMGSTTLPTMPASSGVTEREQGNGDVRQGRDGEAGNDETRPSRRAAVSGRDQRGLCFSSSSRRTRTAKGGDEKEQLAAIGDHIRGPEEHVGVGAREKEHLDKAKAACRRRTGSGSSGLRREGGSRGRFSVRAVKKIKAEDTSAQQQRSAYNTARSHARRVFQASRALARKEPRPELRRRERRVPGATAAVR